MSSYYFLGTYIPEIKLDAPLELSIADYSELLEKHLSAKDKNTWKQFCQGQGTDGFAKSYLQEERHIQLVLVALRAKKWGRSLVSELQDEELKEDPELESIYENFWDEPLALHQALLKHRFKKASDLIGLQTFTLDRLLCYYAQAVLADQFNRSTS